MIATRGLPVIVVLAWATLASAAGGAAFEADLVWDEAFGSGDVRIVGAAWAWNLAAPRAGSANDGPVTGAFLVVEGARVVVRETYYDYQATPVARVGADRSEPAEWRETVLDGGSLRLDAARSDLRMLGVAPGDATTPFRATVEAGSVLMRPVATVRAALMEGATTVDAEDSAFAKTFQRDGSALGLTVPVTPDAIEAHGTFTVHLWEVDVRDADGALYRSGVHRTNGVGAGTAAAPDGVVYDARQQLLTVTVTDGRLRFLVPERPATFFLDAATTSVESTGTWDFTAATGSLQWGRDRRDARAAPVHVAGDLDAALAETDGATVRSAWSGQAEEVVVATEALRLAASEAAQPAGPSARVWALPLLGVVLAAGGGALLVVRQRDRPATRGPARSAPGAAVAAPASPPSPEDVDRELASAVQALQEGRAREVVRRLEPAYDGQHEAAPFRAYVLALAHLRLEDVDAAARWFLEAVARYPDFAKELPVNAALAPLRAHPRVRQQLGVADAAPSDPESVAYA